MCGGSSGADCSDFDDFEFFEGLEDSVDFNKWPSVRVLLNVPFDYRIRRVAFSQHTLGESAESA
jgi:hypothetical protein